MLYLYPCDPESITAYWYWYYSTICLYASLIVPLLVSISFFISLETLALRGGNFFPHPLLIVNSVTLVTVVEKIHPWKLTWNLEMMVFNRNLHFQGFIFRWTMFVLGGVLIEWNLTFFWSCVSFRSVGHEDGQLRLWHLDSPQHTVDVDKILHHLGWLKPYK